MRSFLWKSELGFCTYDLMSLSGPNCQRLVYRPQTPNVTDLGSMLNSIKCCTKPLILKFGWCLFQENCKKTTHQGTPYSAIPDI